MTSTATLRRTRAKGDAQKRSFSTSVDRWSSVGPYYAMFPIEFAFRVVRRYSSEGQSVLDPFAGRGSSVYASATQGRNALGIEINPVGWLYGTVKLNPASQKSVLRRLQEIATRAAAADRECVDDLPEFFRHCYAPGVSTFLLEARRSLNWRQNRTDATLMALILVYLHGKRTQSLSNQMRDSKAMGPDYAVRWWTERAMTAPEVDVVQFMTKRVLWRYKYGVPTTTGTGEVHLGDSTQVLAKVAEMFRLRRRKAFDLLFTSPPYLGVTNYHYDQWLRLWMLGGSDRPQAQEGRWAKKFESRTSYVTLLTSVFAQCAESMRPGAAVYVRTDAREFTLNTTLDALRAAFPGRRIWQIARPLERRTQTALFGDKSTKPGEVDLVINRSRAARRP